MPSMADLGSLLSGVALTALAVQVPFVLRTLRRDGDRRGAEVAEAILAAERARHLAQLGETWNGERLLTSRVAVAALLKEAPPDEVDLKAYLVERGRKAEWNAVASIAQFVRRVSNAFDREAVDRFQAAQEFQGLLWWADRLGLVYGRFPEEATLSGLMTSLRDRFDATRPSR